MNLLSILRPARLTAGLALLLSSAAVTPLRADVIYQFVGACYDCYGGAGNATATLVLADTYSPGTSVSGTDLISFTYDGTDLAPAYTISQTNLSFMNGLLPAGSGPADFQISGCYSHCGNGDVNAYFTTQSSGVWDLHFGSIGTDTGVTSTFNQVTTPEPSSVLLISAGLAGLATLRRRKRSV